MKMYAARPRCTCCNGWYSWRGEARAQGKTEAQDGLREWLDTAGSFSGRMQGSDPCDGGSSPPPATIAVIVV